ncbi:GtrA family protein [uncultured Bacteroides sp.]|uniref:GtrA family protein n=1 Tax=uncultured Bacteroides sp. TaxID=162156 RepID=UPI002AA749C3|nr:GtrA family protein [uncultured Bacteroides sp.]
MKCVVKIMMKIYTRNKANLHQILRFAIVGCIATAIHYTIYYFLQKHLNVNIAYTIGYIVSFFCNFFMTCFLTFRSAPSALKAVGFSFSHLINYLMHMFLLNVFLFLGVSKILAPFFVLSVAVPTNYCLLRFVFTRKNKNNQEPKK